MIRIPIIILLFIFCLTGCALPIKNVSPIHDFGKSYQLGQTLVTNIGSPMLTVYDTYTYPVFKPKYAFQPPAAGVRSVAKLTPDQRWIAAYELNGNYILQSKDYNPIFGVEVTPAGRLGHDHAWINLTGQVNPGSGIPVIRVAQSTWETPDPELFTKVPGTAREGSFKYELIYSGLMKKTITISYREFSDNLARPAFYQELKYDLAESNEIMFRNIRIKVLDANNMNITFQVMDDGGVELSSK